jgi:hypothetical protein
MVVRYNAKTYAELMQLYSELPQEVLDTLVMVKAWGLLDTTDSTGDSGCQYCYDVLNGENTGEECEHYRYLEDVIFPAQWKLWESVGYEKFSYLDYLGHAAPIYLHKPDWQNLDEGYYVVPDPRSGVEEMTYWRRSSTKRGSQKFSPWPQKARYGWVLLRSGIPKDLPKEISQKTYIRAYFDTLVYPYRRAIVEAIEEDPIAAGHRFADFDTRCCSCGRVLTNDLSKVYGIGPECRKGLSSEVLAN